MTSYKTDYIAVNKYTRPGNKRAKTLGIVMHYTASPGGTAANHKSYFGRGADGRYAGAQIFVDKTEAIAITPIGEVCYHANDNQRYVGGKPYRGASGKLGSNANLTTVGVEMCIEKDGSIATATFNRAVNVAAELCKTYGLDATDIYRHYDVTGKNCPAPWVAESSEFNRFKKAVAAKLGTKIKTASVRTKTVGTIKTLVANLNYYNAPTWNKPAGTVKKGTVLTVVSRVLVDGAYQYKTVSGTYITASSKYVKFTAK